MFKRDADDGGIDKAKLRKKVRSMNRRAERRRIRQEEEHRRQEEALASAVLDKTQTIIGLRGEIGTAAHTAAKAERDALQTQLSQLRESKADPTGAAALHALFDSHAQQRREAAVATRQTIRKAALTQHRKRMSMADTQAKHPKPFKNDSDVVDVISRRPEGLGPSQPSQERLGWTKMDFRLKPGQPDFRTRCDEGSFGYVAPARQLKLGGPGSAPPEPDAARLAALKKSAKRRPLWAARHTGPWKSSVQQDGAPAFSSLAPSRPADDDERRMASRYIVPDRVHYKPALEGKPEWKPVRADDSDKDFSRFAPNDVWLRNHNTLEAEALLEKFGIDPLQYKSSREKRVRAAKASARKAPALLGDGDADEFSNRKTVSSGSYVRGGAFNFDVTLARGSQASRDGAQSMQEGRAVASARAFQRTMQGGAIAARASMQGTRPQSTASATGGLWRSRDARARRRPASQAVARSALFDTIARSKLPAKDVAVLASGNTAAAGQGALHSVGRGGHIDRERYAAVLAEASTLGGTSSAVARPGSAGDDLLALTGMQPAPSGSPTGQRLAGKSVQEMSSIGAGVRATAPKYY